MSKQKAVFAFAAAALTALSLPLMPANAEPVSAESAEPAVAAPAPVADSAPVVTPVAGNLEVLPVEASPAAADPASASLLAAPASASLLAAPASASLLAAPASPSVIAAPVAQATASATPAAGPSFSMPNVKLPFPLTLSYRPETGTMGGTGFAPGVPLIAGAPAAPAQFNLASQTAQGWSGTAEVGLPIITLGARMTGYGSVGSFDPSISAADSSNAPAADQLPYYWPESAWSTYVKVFGLRFGYLNEQFNRNIGEGGAIGSYIGGLDSGFNILGLVGVDYHLLAGWGVNGQTVAGTTTAHIPTELDASVYANLGPINLRAGYVARETFTGDPSTFLAIVTDPMSLANDAGKRDTVNATRMGSYMGPYFGAGFSF